MKNLWITALAFGIGLGMIASTQPHKRSPHTASIPVPMCNPDDNLCAPGGN